MLDFVNNHVALATPVVESVYQEGLSLCIPCFNESEHLASSSVKLIEAILNLKAKWEIIFVDDGSRDNTHSLLESVQRQFPLLDIQIIRHNENKGRGAAFLTGVRQSKYNVVGFLDIDLEVSPVYISSFYSNIVNKNADMSIGYRVYKLHFGLIHRHILSRGYHWLAKSILNLPHEMDTEVGYKFFKRETLDRYLDQFQNHGWFWDTEVVVRYLYDGKKIESVPVLFLRNENKTSTVRPIHDSIEYFKNLFQFHRQLKQLRFRQMNNYHSERVITKINSLAVLMTSVF